MQIGELFINFIVDSINSKISLYKKNIHYNIIKIAQRGKKKWKKVEGKLAPALDFSYPKKKRVSETSFVFFYTSKCKLNIKNP